MMHIHKAKELHCFAMSFIISPVFLYCCILCYANNTNAQISEFIKQTVNLQFGNCYGIQIYSKNIQALNWDIPSIQAITSSTTTSNNNFSISEQIFTTNDNHLTSSLVRFGKQCIVYEVHFEDGTKDTSTRLWELFEAPESQKRSKNSYIFLNSHSQNLETIKSILLEPKLKNFPYRVWPTFISPQEAGVTFHHFCFYCNGGSPGIGSTNNKIYNGPEEIRSISEIFPDVTSNLEGHTLRITAPPAPPLVLITVPNNPNNNHDPATHDSSNNFGEIQGQQKNILYGIAEKYNFTCKLYPVPGGSTGSKLPNGTWNGVMGEILYDRADIGLTVATAYDRREIADFTVSVFYAFLVLVSTKPIPHFEWQSIFYPFNVSTWVALIGATFLTHFLFQFLHNRALIMEVVARRKWKSKLLLFQQIKSEIMSGFRAFYMTVGSLLEQSVPVDYNTMPSRMIATFWMFFAIIITCAYRSKLFSFLISPSIETPPSSFLELASSDYSLGMKSLGGIALHFITESPLHYIRYIGEKMDIYTDKYSCLDKTFRSKFTCIIYKAYIDYMMEVRYWKLKSKFHVSDFVTPPVGSAWALQKHSPLKRNFDEMSYRIHEMGLADKYLNDYQVAFAKISRAHAQASNETDEIFDLNANFQNHDETGPKPLAMANLYGAFFILGLGACISAGILLLEIMKRNKFLIKQKRRWALIRAQIKEIRRNKRPQSRVDKIVSFSQFVKLVIPKKQGGESRRTPTMQIHVQSV